MSAPIATPPADPLRDLAADIFAELACRHIAVADGAVKVTGNPEQIARISFKLAEIFQRVDAELKAPSAPKNQSFELRATDLPGFGIPPA